ncbi:hypothetical protein LOS73_17685 [Pseudoalteromonas sp. SCSIO 43210]
MKIILENKRLARFFWICCLLILAVIGLINYYFIGDPKINPTWIKTFSSGVLESLAAAFITTLAIGAFLFYITPKFDPKFGAEFIGSHEFNDHFNNALKTANEWHFRGGFGRYLRTQILPILNKRALQCRAPVIVKAQILDPRNNRLCELHADLRNSVSNIDKKNDWTSIDIKSHLYATIVTCAIFEKNNAFMEVSVYLNCFFSTDRVDVCGSYGLVTKEDRKVPGLRFRKDTSHYNAYKGDLSVTQKQADVVKVISQSYTIGDLTKNNVKSILTELNFEEPSFSDLEYETIANLVNGKENPYA